MPGKNLIDLAGKPLIAWTIEAAIKSGVFDDIVVSSDDGHILAVASKYDDIITLKRPDHLASDTATTTDAVAHALEELEARGTRAHDVVVVLQPTSPLRQAEDIIAAFKQFVHGQSPALVSVCELDHPIEWSGTLDSNGRLTGLSSALHRSQDYKKRYRLNGAIYICHRDDIQFGGPLLTGEPLAYVMPRSRSLDIDTSIDFKLCELILNDD
ncbi:acylneuraminate cytidylyltransferase [Alcanivorax venustensis ISO4]|uniref:Acylneuraminate cytidylyltransferase n=1 Tax=Alloalcanivorax venustensis ISO4 TaxID=1177184 RepID=A0ABS0AFB0_9GAMM|nr:acylneuraminate cytidylyltransferase [Alloalcanivorax venustensis ISO4]